MTPEVIQMYLEDRFRTSDMHTTYTAVYTIIRSDGNYHNKSGPCHGQVRNYAMDYNNSCGVVTKMAKNFRNREGVVKFYDWLLNSSPVRDVFPVKDARAACRLGVLKSLDSNNAQFLVASQLSRLSTSEFSHQLSLVADILELGYDVNPGVLLQIINAFNATKTNSGKREFIYAQRLPVTAYFSDHFPRLTNDRISSLKFIKAGQPLSAEMARSFFGQPKTLREALWPGASYRAYIGDPNAGEPCLPMYNSLITEKKELGELVAPDILIPGAKKDTNSNLIDPWPGVTSILKNYTSEPVKGSYINLSKLIEVINAL